MKHRLMRVLLLLVGVVAGHLSRAQAQADGEAAPNCTTEAHRQFDFWVGEWEVTVSGQRAGTNDITNILDGCVLHEHWTGAKGGTGQSFNFYNRQDKKWHQVWVDNKGVVLTFAGEYRDGRLNYTGESIGQDGKVVRHKLTFFKNPDGTVRQLWESSQDGGKSWQTVFDGLYTRKG